MFAVIGEALLDMVQRTPGGAFDAVPGGGPLNIAVGLQRQGHPTALLARFSTGQLGSIVREHAERNDLDLGASVSTSDPTTLAFATLDDTGQASYDFYVDGTADWGWSADELSALPDETQAVHTGSVAAFLAPGADAILDLYERLRAVGETLLSFDPNVRPALVGERSAAVAHVERFVAASHVVKASDEDLEWLYPHQSLSDVLHQWASLGPDIVVATRGAQGCLALRSGHEPVEVGGLLVDVVDTIGAGDAFEAGLLSGLADEGCLSPGAVGKLSDETVRTVLEKATAVSAMTCERPGADPPTRAELAARPHFRPA